MKASTQSTDQQLIRQAQSGNLSAFEHLVRRYQQPIYYFTLKILRRPETAQDATQETFLRVFKHLAKFDLRKSFKPWIYQIAKNYSLDLIRKQSKILPLTQEVPDHRQPILATIIKKEQLMALKNALKQLPSKYRRLVVGHYFHQLDYQKLSHLFDLPINTIKTRMRRARLYLLVNMQTQTYV